MSISYYIILASKLIKCPCKLKSRIDDVGSDDIYSGEIATDKETYLKLVDEVWGDTNLPYHFSLCMNNQVIAHRCICQSGYGSDGSSWITGFIVKY